jgi:hypothetical protein
MAGSEERYAFDAYMFGGELPERHFDSELEAEKAYGAAAILRLVAPTDNFALEPPAENMLHPWVSLRESRQQACELVKDVMSTEERSNQHALLGKLMNALQPEGIGSKLWQSGNPPEVSRRERMPMSMLRYILAVKVKAWAQEEGLIDIDPRSGDVVCR